MKVDRFEFTIRGDLMPAEEKQLINLLRSNLDRFTEDLKELEQCNVLQHEIRTGDNKPFQEALRQIPFAQRAEVDKIVGEMINAGVARPSSSPWASAIVMVKKKDGSWRLCVDYRRLNALSTPDRYPLPRIEDILARIQG
ncbi:krab-a domain-containing protein-like protein, partial [Dinothrombium tinctorium]